MLPDLNKHGFLPEGVWDCSLVELSKRFAVFAESDKRIKLFQRLENLLEEVKKTGWIMEVIVDGSFVTDKKKPNDIDLILALMPEFEDAEISFWTSNLLDARKLGSKYKFDIFIEIYGSRGYKNKLDFFQDVRDSDLRKGVVRLKYDD